MRSVAVAERSRRVAVSDLRFVGCRPVQVSAAEIEGPDWEGRNVEHSSGEADFRARLGG